MKPTKQINEIKIIIIFFTKTTSPSNIHFVYSISLYNNYPYELHKICLDDPSKDYFYNQMIFVEINLSMAKKLIQYQISFRQQD